MYLSILFLPLAGMCLSSLMGKRIGPSGAAMITCTFLGITLLHCLYSFVLVLLTGKTTLVFLVNWIVSGNFYVTWALVFDTLTSVMVNVVCFISFLVHIYASEYMGHDPHLARFMSYLSFFTFFMLILVTGDNFLQLFVGWEGVGLCSFLLINFWFTRIQANKAANKAMILNRVGDVALALGIFLIFQTFGSIDYSIVFLLIPQATFFTVKFFGINIHLLTLIGILLFIGCMGKSAQFGLHTWLGDAMEGPTPVSALIHAATMVTAGIFLLARCSIIFEYAPDVRLFIAIIGVLTAFFAASTGLLQNDLKKVIAYSTASQLGYMMLACGLSNYGTGFFHLSNHAFFKALLFLSAGSIIHSTLDEQDLRRLGGLRRILPFAYSAMVVGSFSLFGVPFLSGFYSKDAILELAAVQPTPEAKLCFILGSITAFLTAFYSMRLLYLVFLSPANGYRMVYLHSHEAPIKIALPLIVLSIPSIIIGFLSKDMFIGFGTNFWNNSLSVLPENQFLVDSEFLPFFSKQTPLILATSGAVSSFFLYKNFSTILVLIKLSSFGRGIYTFLNRKWFIDKAYNAVVALPLLYFSYSISYKTIDKGLIEITGPKTAKYLAGQGRLVNTLSPALLYSSVLLFFLGFLSLVFIQFLSFYKKIVFIQLAIFAVITIGQKAS